MGAILVIVTIPMILGTEAVTPPHLSGRLGTAPGGGRSTLAWLLKYGLLRPAAEQAPRPAARRAGVVNPRPFAPGGLTAPLAGPRAFNCRPAAGRPTRAAACPSRPRPGAGRRG
jgi:hypothetical protein